MRSRLITVVQVSFIPAREFLTALWEEASRKCIEMHVCKYSYFKRVLGTVANSTDSGGGGKSLPSHENIRGKDFYK
ncbi:MAG: hypothetical protein V8S42_09290 [Lachnospiraceae bacterium]